MANVKYAYPIEEIRGSIGGTTFTRSRAGTIARLRNTPRRPISAPLGLVKPYLASAVRGWYASLTQPQRDAWDALGSATTWQNSLGDNYNPSGQNLFVRAFTIATIAGYTPTPDPPNVADEPDPGFTWQYAPPKWVNILSYGTLTSPPDGRLIAWHSPYLPPSSKTFNHPWTLYTIRTISTLDPAPTTWLTLPDPHPDLRLFMRFRIYRQHPGPPPPVTGRTSLVWIDQLFCPASP